MNLKRVHLLSGLTITLFIGAHLFNHVFSIFGAEAHLDIMEKLRVVYRNVLAEAILLAAVCVQIFSGLKLFFRKRKADLNFYKKMQIRTGLYLSFFLLIHVSAVGIGRYILELDTNFYFGAAGLNTFPLNLFFVPYYGLAILSFFGHLAGIHHSKMRKKVLGLSIAGQANLILITGMILTLIILYGMTNGFAGAEIPAAYNIMTEK